MGVRSGRYNWEEFHGLVHPGWSGSLDATVPWTQQTEWNTRWIYRIKNKSVNSDGVRTRTKPRIENGVFIGAIGRLIDVTDPEADGGSPAGERAGGFFSIDPGVHDPHVLWSGGSTVIYWNKALEEWAESLRGSSWDKTAMAVPLRGGETCMAESGCGWDLLTEYRSVRGKVRESPLIDEAYEATDYFPILA